MCAERPVMAGSGCSAKATTPAGRGATRRSPTPGRPRVRTGFATKRAFFLAALEIGRDGHQVFADDLEPGNVAPPAATVAATALELWITRWPARSRTYPLRNNNSPFLTKFDGRPEAGIPAVR